MSLPSIRERLSRSALTAAVGWGLASALLVGLVVRHEVDVLLDGALQESAEILYGLMPPTLAAEAGVAGSVAAPPHEESLVWQVVSDRGQVLLRSSRAPSAPLAPDGSLGLSDSPLGWRVYALELDHDRSLRLQVAQSASDRRRAQWSLMAAIVGVSLLVGAGSAWWLRRRVRRELLPLASLSEQVLAYNPVDPRTVLPGAQRQELLPMQDSITALGQRLARLVSNERAFSAHAAHALRTPLAGMDAQLALALRECPPQMQPRLQLARDASGRLVRVVAALLTLFRSGGQLTRHDIDVAEMAAELPSVGLRVEVVSAYRISADADLLAAVLINLFENAVRHGATTAHIKVTPNEGGWSVWIQDDGRGLAEPERLVLQRELDRQTYDGGHGLGLGLTLADIVARAHGGRLVLHGAERGACIELQLAATA